MSFWVVAFLDLLGYRSVLSRFDVYPLPETLTERDLISRAYARAFHLRTRLLDGVQELMRAQEAVPPPELSQFPQAARDLAARWRSIETVHSLGPDHVILACSLAPSSHHFPMTAVHTLVTAAASAMLVQLAIGADDLEGSLPLRGGIDVAPGGTHGSPRFLYSPAVARAYELESHHANFPRTLSGERFLGYLASTAAEGGTALDDQYAQALARRLVRMFFRDHDGRMALDFLGDAFREQMPPEFAAHLASKAWLFVRRANHEFRDRDAIAAKYAWLMDYMEPRLAAWGVNVAARNGTLDRPSGSRALAVAGQRERQDCLSGEGGPGQ